MPLTVKNPSRGPSLPSSTVLIHLLPIMCNFDKARARAPSLAGRNIALPLPKVLNEQCVSPTEELTHVPSTEVFICMDQNLTPTTNI